jgi:zinc D-Ala-D-Ala dipeptidase
VAKNGVYIVFNQKQLFVILFWVVNAGMLLSCQEQVNESIEQNRVEEKMTDTLFAPVEVLPEILDTCHWYDYLEQLGLVDIKAVDSTIWVDLKYATTDNFMQKDVYGCLRRCYLQPDVAQRIEVVQQELKSIDSTLSLKIFDGLRPRSVQQYMWDILDMPITEKTKFVSNPKNGSLHNFGAAVDITIVNTLTGDELDMGAPYDYIGVLAWPKKEPELLASGELSQEQVNNRILLRKVMKAGYFTNIQTEWWHFNACSREKAYQLYTIVE